MNTFERRTLTSQQGDIDPNDIKVWGFDLDDTLAESKQSIGAKMGEQLMQLLAIRNVAIITGGTWEQVDKQVISRLPDPDPESLKRMHPFPTCGTRSLDYVDGVWEEVYAENIDPEHKRLIIETLETAAKEEGLWVPKPYGEIIEDRGSQITFSALGQQAPPEIKKGWDTNGERRARLIANAAERLGDLEYDLRSGGASSVDVTQRGVDKAYGIRKLSERLNHSYREIGFVGDQLSPGGNDYPARTVTGVKTFEVSNPDDTIQLIEQIVAAA